MFRRTISSLVLVALAAGAHAQSLDARYLEGLRQRQLFELAERYCVDRLSRVKAGDSVQAELTVELIRTLSLRAANAPPPGRPELWTKAHAAAASFLRQTPPHPRSVVVRFQDALTYLAEGELGRQDFEARAVAADLLQPIRQALRTASGLLEQLDKELTAEIPLARRRAPRPGEFAPGEMVQIQEQVQHQLARAQRNQGLLFQPDSDDRLSLLLAASETLKRALSQATTGEPLHAVLALDLAECQRLLGKLDEAGELAAALDAEGTPAATRVLARAESIRVAIARKDGRTVQQLVNQGRTIGGQSSAELDFAIFEGLIALATLAPGGILESRAAEAARFLEETYGPYWGRRANQVLIAATPRGGSQNVALLSRAADGLYVSGRLEEALAAYDDAAGAARGGGDLQAAFELAYKAALLEQKRKRHLPAADRLRMLARNLASHSQAPQAHLLAAWNAAHGASNDSAAMNLYEELLGEHLALWPEAETAGQARVWLGKHREARSDWSGAVEAYLGVTPSSPHYQEAIERLARCWRQEIVALDAGRAAETAQRAIQHFWHAVTGPTNRWPERWTQADRVAALAAAELIASYQPMNLADAEEMLRRALASSAEAPAEWQTAARAQLIVVLAAQSDKQDQALAELQSMGKESTEKMLTVLDGLSRISARASAAARPGIARLQLASIELLGASERALSAQEQLTLHRIRADALSQLGRRDEALAAYESLTKTHPDDGAIQMGYARLLTTSSDSASLQLALDQWRRVASRTPPRTSRWFEAKYNVALMQFKLGARGEAAALLRYMLLTPPGLKGTEWEAAYQELLKKCGD